MLPIAPRPATDAEIVAAHTVEHKDYIATLATMDTETIRSATWLAGSVRAICVPLLPE